MTIYEDNLQLQTSSILNSGKEKLKYCASDEMFADIYTEALSHEQFSKLCNKARIMEKPWTPHQVNVRRNVEVLHLCLL